MNAPEEKAVAITLSAEARAAMLQGESSIFLNMAKFEHAQRVAGMLMSAKMWPDHIRTTGDALIILNMADRMQADPFMLAQRVYIVHGKPGLEGKLVISLINNSGKYSEPIRFEFSGPRDADPSDSYDAEQDTKQADAYGCRAITVDKRSGKTVRGPKITWKIVKAEGWLGKQGSKWKTMAELMFQYRSASWFANVNCPEVTLGLPTADELRDVVELKADSDGKFSAPETEKKPITFQDDPTGDKPTRKPRSDKGTKRAAEEPNQRAPEATQQPQDEDIPNTMHPDSDDPMATELARLRAEIAQHDKVDHTVGTKARHELGMGLTYTPANIDGCRVLLERIEAILKERK
jgi:hypothetical protein